MSRVYNFSAVSSCQRGNLFQHRTLLANDDTFVAGFFTVNGIIDIDATIYCEKASHKGIIIGKQGTMLKKISSLARTDCEKFMGTKVYLTTWVKVKENWRDSDFLVRNFGYTE